MIVCEWCPYCAGEGRADGKRCPYCHGGRIVETEYPDYPEPDYPEPDYPEPDDFAEKEVTK